MRALVVEDELRLREDLSDRLRQQGFAVDACADGDEALWLGREIPFDVAVIDLGLPGISGMELIKRLRAAERGYPILILTARGSWQDKVEGLEAGADDYLAKPFVMEELLARLRALLRRAGGRATPMVCLGPVTLDPRNQEVRLHRQVIELTAYEYRLLEYLMQRPGQVISKTELTEHLYDQDFDCDSNVIEVFVGRLRRKLDPDGKLRPITTRRGRGYSLDLEPAAPATGS